MAPSLLKRHDERLLTPILETVAHLEETVGQETAQASFAMERLAELELALDDIGWHRLSLENDWEFSRDGIDRIVALSRLNTLKNPLIKRAVHLKADYVFGQGVEISARDDDINTDVIQPFLDDPANAKVLFSDVALPAKDRTLTTDGNVVLVLFPNPLTGHVSVRSVPVDEIRDIITNPRDRAEVWFYKRCWIEREFIADEYSGTYRTVTREAWHPDWRYQPATQTPTIDRAPVDWGAPIYHATVGGLDGMRFGIPETYAALDWAKAYKLFLEDWSTIVRSLSRFAWQLVVKRNPKAAAQKLGTTVSPSAPRDMNPSPAAGAVFTGAEGTDLKALPKTDAVIASEDGIWLAKMVAAAVGIPYTILMGDPDVGNLATAKTLDRPTELGMIGRQRVWAEILRDLCSFAIDWAIRAPGGKLAGRSETGPDGRPRLVVDPVTKSGAKGIDGAPDQPDEEVSGADRRTIDVTFPAILEDDILERIKAIVTAGDTELPPPDVILRLLLTALGVDDIDEIVAALPERLEAKATAGAAAIAAFRQGQDPAATLNGQPPTPAPPTGEDDPHELPDP